MSTWNRVIWSEGMFIRPQHFQQQERFLQAQIRGQPSALAPYHYGFCELKLNEALLEQGKIALLCAQGVFQDGTLFSCPQQDSLPTPLQIPEGITQTKIYLCIPMQAMNALEVAYEKNQACRYCSTVMEIADNTSSEQSTAEIELGKLQLCLLREEDDRSDFCCLQISEIKAVRSDKKIIIEKDFIPALLEISVDIRLIQLVDEMRGLLQNRANILAQRLTNTQQFESESAPAIDLMLLAIINRYETQFRQMQNRFNLHPLFLFETCNQLLAEISTYTKDTRRPLIQTNYAHEKLFLTFFPLMKECRHCLSMTLEQHAVAINLVSQNYGVYIGQVEDPTLFENSVMILAVCADDQPEAVRKTFAMKTKISALENIRDLVSRGIPGVPLAALAIAPRQIPYHVNFAYFRIDDQHELWKSILHTGSIAIHVGGQYSQLRLELWAIRA